jgi:hypothetical protein
MDHMVFLTQPIVFIIRGKYTSKISIGNKGKDMRRQRQRLERGLYKQQLTKDC